ncbi:MAG: YceH family protein [Acidobacteriota bacterium]
MEPLHPAEVRVLGALIEKDLTTPEYYPLTLNALQNACNQKSSREPIVHYDEETVAQALQSLRDRQLASRISGAGHRVEKYGHRLGDLLNLGRREMAVLCVLMLRGPQTVGELRGRTERMHEFSDMEEVEHVLSSLASRVPDPLTAPVARGRWVHLWSGADAAWDSPLADAASAISSHRPQPVVDDQLLQRVETLEREVAELRAEIRSFRDQFE